jgi:hypothetical protein
MFNQSLNLGLQTKLKKQLDFNTSIGINYTFKKFNSDNPFLLRFEMGLVYVFRKNNE